MSTTPEKIVLHNARQRTLGTRFGIHLVQSNFRMTVTEMKEREQNRKNKRTEIERFDWFMKRIQTLVAFGWLSELKSEKTSYPRTF